MRMKAYVIIGAEANPLLAQEAKQSLARKRNRAWCKSETEFGRKSSQTFCALNECRGTVIEFWRYSKCWVAFEKFVQNDH